MLRAARWGKKVLISTISSASSCRTSCVRSRSRRQLRRSRTSYELLPWDLKAPTHISNKPSKILVDSYKYEVASTRSTVPPQLMLNQGPTFESLANNLNMIGSLLEKLADGDGLHEQVEAEMQPALRDMRDATIQATPTPAPAADNMQVDGTPPNGAPAGDQAPRTLLNPQTFLITFHKMFTQFLDCPPEVLKDIHGQSSTSCDHYWSFLPALPSASRSC